jgi:hypothetical protein
MVMSAKRFGTNVPLKYLSLSLKKLPFYLRINHVHVKKGLKLLQGAT